MSPYFTRVTYLPTPPFLFLSEIFSFRLNEVMGELPGFIGSGLTFLGAGPIFSA